MGPFEALIAFTSIVSLFVVMPWIIANAFRKRSGGAEMRRSELDALIEEAVAEATAPLVRRIETLEAIATATDSETERQLDPAVLADVLEPGPEVESQSVGPRRSRA